MADPDLNEFPVPRPNDPSQALQRLEERVAFQERSLDQLNRVVAEQQLELDALQREVKELRLLRVSGSQTEGNETRTLEDDRPPHY